MEVLIKRVLLAGLCSVLCLAVMPARPAAADEPQSGPSYEKSEEFEKSKEDFGNQPGEEANKEENQAKPPVSIRLGKRTEHGAWGGWGGPMVGYISLDFSVLDPMTRDRRISGFEDNMLMIGGLGGFAYYPDDMKGWWYVGAMGFGFSQSESERIAGDNRKAGMTIGGGGVFVEYHQPLVPRLDLAAGAMVGAGTITLTAEGDDLGIVGGGEWSATRVFPIGYPYAGLSLQVTNWMKVEATAGYMFMNADITGSDFTVEDSGMDMTDGNLQGGPQYMLRALFGYGG